MKEYLVTLDDGRQFYVPAFSRGEACLLVQQYRCSGFVPLVQIHAQPTGRRL